jgi:hypothetical protein
MSKSKSDHAIAIVKAGLNLVPGVGGALASLIGDYVPTHTQRSIETAIGMLKEDLNTLGERIDLNNVNRDEFAELFKSCYLSIVRTHQEKKLRAAVGLLSNILLKEGDADKLSYTELDHFARCIESLSIGAVEVLGHAAKLASQGRRNRSSSGDVMIDFGELRAQMPGISPHLLMGLVQELNSCNLLHIRQYPSVGIESDPYGNYPIVYTSLGSRFVSRVCKA